LIAAVILCVVGWKMAAYFCVWLMGVMAYRLSRVEFLRQRSIGGWTILAALIVANHVIVYSTSLSIPEVLRDLVFSVAVALLLSPNVRCPPLGGGWGIRLNSFMADFSYSIYAFHTPVIFFLCAVFLGPRFDAMLPTFAAGLILVVTALGIARLFFHVAEAKRAVFRQRADAVMRRVGI
jgi:peptidoglycan/LPS O-acetylase OafA/YrhL